MKELNKLIQIITVFSFVLSLHAAEKVIINHINWDSSQLDSSLLDEVRLKKIMFGHQSVGADITNGLSALSSNNPSRYYINIITNPSCLDQPSFGEWYNGTNGDPQGKIVAFCSKMRAKDTNENIWAEAVDFAYFKFCYVDFNSSSLDINALFNQYMDSLQALISDFPNTKFVYVTAPLYRAKNEGEMAANKRRHDFNELLRSYVNIEGGYLYDLADLESHDENGVLQTFQYQESDYPMTWYVESDPHNDGWSYDGGHLNAGGREHMALAKWSLWAVIIEKQTLNELGLSIPESASEGDSILNNQGIVSIPEPADSDLLVSLLSADTTEVFVPKTVTIQAGQSYINFNLLIKDDEEVDGNQTVIVTASADNWISCTDTIVIFDNDTLNHIKVVDNSIPYLYYLEQNYPNPFNPETKIFFRTALPEIVRIVIYNTTGQKVVTLLNKFKNGGRYSVKWKGLDERGRPAPSGIYFYHITAGSYFETKKMLLLR
jgi:hypothetical protein